MDIDQHLQRIKRRNILNEREFRQVIRKVIQIFAEQNNLQPVNAPVNICGDIHGQFYDLLKLFQIGGEVGINNYIFLGDYVDRGNNSVETLQYLLCLKIKFPDRLTLLRGNHQSRQVTMCYGFYQEIKKKYGNINSWKQCMQLFDYMPVAAIVDNKYYCIHGGLSPQIRRIQQIRGIDRVQQVPVKGPLCDLMWSDPSDIRHWAQNQRGAGWLFGSVIAKQFCRINGLQLICRAHQLANDGYVYWFQQKSLVTIWSAPNYCKKCNNMASIMKVDQKLDRQFKKFGEAQEPQGNVPYKQLIPYFL